MNEITINHLVEIGVEITEIKEEQKLLDLANAINELTMSGGCKYDACEIIQHELDNGNGEMMSYLFKRIWIDKKGNIKHH